MSSMESTMRSTMNTMNTFENMLVPISLKGDFFQDTFFQQSRNNFMSAVQRVMSRWHQQQDIHDQFMSMFNSDRHLAVEHQQHGRNLVDTYRTLRLKDLRQDNQAVTVTKNGNIHQIVLDVNGFDSNDLSVRVEGETKLIVEGKQTKQTEGSSSCQQFSKTFNLPGLKCSEITAVLSTDGVFTINAPVQMQRSISGVTIPIQISDSSCDINSIAQNQTSQKQDLQNSCSTKQDEKDENISSQKKTEITSTVQTQKLPSRQESIIEEGFIPLTLKGSFLQDDFADGFRSNFVNSVSDIVKKWDSEAVPQLSSNEDIFSHYRKLRKTTLKEENQASTVTDDETSYKVVVDIYDYLDGEVKVNVIDNKKLTVEGKIKQTEPSTKQSSFKRSFVLSNMGKCEDISAVVSEDGILTVIVPKQISMDKNKCIIGNKTESNIKEVSNITEELKSNETQCVKNKTLVESIQKNSESVQNVRKSSVTSIPKKHQITISPMDDFFTSSKPQKDQNNFLQSVKKVLDQWGVSSRDDDWKSYKTFRRQTSAEENQAVTFTEETDHFKILLDAEGFKNEDIRVRLVNGDQLVVEGTVKTTTDTSSIRHNFKRNFYLPSHVSVDEIKSSLSTDGILCINIPKIIMNKEKLIPVEMDDVTFSNKNEKQTIVESAVEKKEVKQSQNKPHEKIIEICESKDENIVKDHKVSVKESDSKVAQSTFTGEQEGDIKISVRHESSKDQTSGDQVVFVHKIEDVTSELANSEQAQNASSKQCTKQKVEEEVANKSSSNCQQISSDTSSCKMNQVFDNLPIARKEDFFKDSFFNQVQSAYKQSVNNILQSWNISPVETDWMNQYKLLRANNCTDESQAVSITHDEHSHKVVLDVEAFKDGNIRVRAINSHELIVEGEISVSKNGGSSKQSFKRCFYLPETIDMKNVTSAMSSDGVLTIIAPKKEYTNAMHQIDNQGNTSALEQSQILSQGNEQGQGSSFHQHNEQSSSGDGFSTKTISSSFKSNFSSSS